MPEQSLPREEAVGRFQTLNRVLFLQGTRHWQKSRSTSSTRGLARKASIRGQLQSRENAGFSMPPTKPRVRASSAKRTDTSSKALACWTLSS